MTDPDPLCEDLFHRLTTEDPARLVALLRTEMDPCDLTFAAEIAGKGIVGHGVGDALTALLEHPERVVREGALYGLAHHPSPELIARVRRMATEDESPAVRSVARETLKYWSPEFTGGEK